MSQNLPAVKTAVLEAVQTISLLLGSPERARESVEKSPAPSANE
jgi:hypothetical protein